MTLLARNCVLALVWVGTMCMDEFQVSLFPMIVLIRHHATVKRLLRQCWLKRWRCQYWLLPSKLTPTTNEKCKRYKKCYFCVCLISQNRKAPFGTIKSDIYLQLCTHLIILRPLGFTWRKRRRGSLRSRKKPPILGPLPAKLSASWIIGVFLQVRITPYFQVHWSAQGLVMAKTCALLTNFACMNVFDEWLLHWIKCQWYLWLYIVYVFNEWTYTFLNENGKSSEVTVKARC